MINKGKIFSVIFFVIAIVLGVLCAISFIHMINYLRAISNCQSDIILDGIHGNIKQLNLLENKSISFFVLTGAGTSISAVLCWITWKI